MKTLFAIVASVLTAIALPQQAQAGHTNSSYTYHSGSSSCGCPIYTQRIFAGYDCYNRPVYRYVSVPVQHRCGHSRHDNHGYQHSSYTRSGYGYGYSRSYYSRGCR